MTINQLKYLLLRNGIWRCEIVQPLENPGYMGVLELRIPRTSWHRIDFIFDQAPAGCMVRVVEMKNPLRLKKYSYPISFR
ncbi:hypothetical protein VPHD479_0294 [Vibrio phage D479]